MPYFIEKLQKKYQVYAPVKKDGEYGFELLTSGEFHMPPLESPVTVLGLKKIFWPDGEMIWENQGEQNKIKEQTKPIAVIGVHRADLEAVFILDKILKNDSLYWEKRKKSLILLTEKADPENYRFTFYNLAPRGFKFFRDELLHHPNLSRLIEKSKGGEIWKKVAKKCLACGICSYVCPLCYCFEVEDKLDLTNENCRRCRQWDGCFLPHFMEMAGGVNPQPTLADRLYNWYHHKFVRMPSEINEIGCTNCGRCIKYCPVKINFREVIEELK